MGEWFPVNVRLRPGCVMSSWLFILYMVGMVRDVNTKMLGKVQELLLANGGRFGISQLLLAADRHLLACG